MSRLVTLLLAPLLATTACVAEVPGTDTGSGSNADDTLTSEAALSNNEKTAFNYFVSKGLTATESAAIVGNLMQESSVNPAAVEPGGPGRGIAQWSVGGRWNTSTHDNLSWYVATNGGSTGSVNTQLDFIWYELTTFSGYGLAKLKSAPTLTAAVVDFQTDFEICGTCAQSQRISYAEQVLAAYGSGTTTSTGAGCYSGTLGRTMVDNACVESKFNNDWYQCSDGEWVDRWTDPDACVGVYPL